MAVGVYAADGSLRATITAGSTGIVVGPASSTDNALVRYDGTTGKLTQDSSGAILSDNFALSLTEPAITADEPILNLATTWNNAGVLFTGIKLAITSTASSASSLPLNITVGGSSILSVARAGNFTVAGSLTAASNVLSTSSAALLAFGASADVLLGRAAAASWRFGAADAAAPVAQTLSVQSVVTGTTDTAGANWTFKASQGTGTGASGSIIFQTGSAGSTGSTVNALGGTATISGTGNLSLSGSFTLGSTATIAFGSRSKISSASDGAVLFTNNAGTANTADVTASHFVTSATDFMAKTTGTLTNGAAAQAGTLLNAPTAGNPTKWIPISDNGTTRYIPAW